MGQITTVNFRGAELYGFDRDDGVFVALKPIVEAMGLDWSAQFRRVQRDPILAEGIAIMATPFGRGGAQDAVCLKLELVNGWLFTIDSSRIKDPEVRDRVLLYQRECYAVLHEHFHGSPRRAELEGPPSSEESIGIRRSLVTEARQSFGTQAARELWFALELPRVPAMLMPPAEPDLFTYTAERREPGEQPGTGGH
jgi:hypothetical protein